MAANSGFPGRTPSAETRRDVEAALAARSELGPEYEDHIAASLAERVEQLAAYRSAELAHQDRVEQAALRNERTTQHERFVLGLSSLVAGIPVTAITATQVHPSLIGVAVSWAGIVGVNVAHAWASRRRGNP